jgi:hypothetical protein
MFSRLNQLASKVRAGPRLMNMVQKRHMQIEKTFWYETPLADRVGKSYVRDINFPCVFEILWVATFWFG